MNRFEVRETTSITNYDWNELVINSPQSTIFHTSDWLNLISRCMGRKQQVLQCYDILSDPPRIVGGCVFFTYKKFFFKIATDRFNATPYGGIILISSPSNNQREIESWQNEILGSFLDTFKAKNYDLIKLVHSPALFDVRPFILDGWNCDVLYTYILDLKNDFEKKCSKEVKWAIKKAIKNKISIKKIDALKPCHIASYMNLHHMTFQRQGLDYPFPHNFITELLRILYKKGKGKLWFAETASGEIAAAEIIVYDNKMAHRWSAASHTEFQKTGAVSFLLSEVAKYLKNELGYTKFNLMAANTPQLSKFISAFNPQIIPYYSTTKISKLYNITSKTYRLVV